MAQLPVVVVEDDPFTRLIPIVLDPASSAVRRAAFADFMSPDEPDFDGWVKRVREGAAGLFPARVIMLEAQDEMRASLGDCHALVVESFSVGRDDLAAAPHLKVVQRFGALLRSIDIGACKDRGVKVLNLRRRANISCAEHVFALMLALARRLDASRACLTVPQIEASGSTLRPFDRRHTPGGNYARVGGTRALKRLKRTTKSVKSRTALLRALSSLMCCGSLSDATAAATPNVFTLYGIRQADIFLIVATSPMA